MGLGTGRAKCYSLEGHVLMLFRSILFRNGNTKNGEIMIPGKKVERDPKANVQRVILMGIAKEIRKARGKRRGKEPSELRDIYAAKVAILEQVFDLVKSTPPGWVRRMLQEFVRERDLDYRACRNPGMKLYLRFQARTVRKLLGGARTAH
jgi:hypothetical protein